MCGRRTASATSTCSGMKALTSLKVRLSFMTLICGTISTSMMPLTGCRLPHLPTMAESPKQRGLFHSLYGCGCGKAGSARALPLWRSCTSLDDPLPAANHLGNLPSDLPFQPINPPQVRSTSLLVALCECGNRPLLERLIDSAVDDGLAVLLKLEIDSGQGFEQWLQNSWSLRRGGANR